MKKIISVPLSRKEMKAWLQAQFSTLDARLNALYAEQLAVNKTADSRFIGYDFSEAIKLVDVSPGKKKYPALLYLDLLGWARPQHTFLPPGFDGCFLCVGYRGGADYRDPVARQAWKTDHPIRVFNLWVGDQLRKFSFFPSNSPYLPSHFVIAEGVGKEHRHTPWQTDIRSLVQLAAQTDQYYVAQNSVFGASVPGHLHFQAFTFPQALPIEQASTELIRTIEIGPNRLTFEKCIYPQSTLKVTIDNVAEINTGVFERLERIIGNYKDLNAANDVNIVAKKKGKEIEVYIFFIRPTNDPDREVSYGTASQRPLKRVPPGFVHSMGVMLRRCLEDEEYWQSESPVFSDILASYSAPPKQLEPLYNSLRGCE
ncbi:DUF4922 domain-containing protein [bacterium]|nr:DUF4922 domain-containing protein [bacterium]MBT4552839.1 DUF4922 domain-containing protein [bacterium]